MKAQDLWAGSKYAWMPERPKGVETPLNATPVRLIRTIRKKNDYYSERLSTWAEVEIMEDRDYQYKKGTVHQVRARDIIDHWDDYQDREEALLEERRRAERLRSQERAREESENREIEEEFSKIGLRVSIYSDYVHISRKTAREWLRERRANVAPGQNYL